MIEDRRKLLLPVLMLIAWLGMVSFWTHGFRAFTNFSAARYAAGPLPRPAPPLEVIDQTGKHWDIAQPGSTYHLVQAMYLNCPGVCPIAMAKLGEISRALVDIPTSRLQVLSLSVDHDSASALQAMWKAHGSQSNWSLASLTVSPIEPILEQLGIYMFRRVDGLINHSVDILLIDPQGQVVRVFSADDEVMTTVAAIRSALP